MQKTEFAFQKEGLWIMIICLSMCLLYTLVTYLVTFRVRCQIFNSDFMMQFNEEQEDAFGTKIKAPLFGYPDTGNGYFAKKLPYKDWFRFNNAQRVQINFLEHITFAIIGPLVVGIKYPMWGLVCAGLIIVGRLLFCIGYSIGGP